MNIPEVTLRCSNGFTLHTRGPNLVVEAKRTEEFFPIAKIQSFALKEPRGLGMGKITFHTAQAASAGVGLGLGVSAAIGAEKVFFFSKADLAIAIQIRDYISSYDAEKAAPEGKVVSVVEEIRGLKELLDDGILSANSSASDTLWIWYLYRIYRVAIHRVRACVCARSCAHCLCTCICI